MPLRLFCANYFGRNPKGSGYQLYLFCEKTKKDAASIPYAEKTKHID
jgi:hypothetical protein